MFSNSLLLEHNCIRHLDNLAFSLSMIHQRGILTYFKILAAVCFCCIYSHTCEAQRGVEVGVHAGLSHYFGDLNPTFTISDPGFQAGLTFRRNFNERLCATLGLDYGRISGSDSNSFNSFERNRNLDFRSNYAEASFTFEFNFFTYVHGSEDYNFTPYLFGGFVFSRFNPMTDLDGITYELRDFNTEGVSYGLSSGGWVYGFGFKWDINRDYSFNVYLSGRRLFNDYVDDVSNNFPSRTPTDPIAAALSNRSGDTNFGAPGTQRGDGFERDQVYFLSVGFLRYFGPLNCPPISKTAF